MPNENSTPLSMDDLHTATSAEINAAAAAEDRIETGTYLAKVNAIFPKRMADDAEYDAGRSLASLATDLYDPNDPSTRMGKLFLKVSWEPRYNRAGRLDNTARRYSELAKAVSAPRTASPGEVLDLARQQMFSIKVRETFQVSTQHLHDFHLGVQVGSDGMAWVVVPPGEPEMFDYYTDLGYEGRSMVDRVFKA